jgi:3-methylfumaryl-CoA hydratase
MSMQGGEAWIGKQEVRSAEIAPALIAMLGATVDADWDAGAGTRPGSVLPPLWHWVVFPPQVPMSGLGPDGHPRLGGFLPDLGLARRMWAGGALEFHRPLHLGERLTQASTLTNVVEKTGAAGRMVFVTVAHELSGEDGLAISERQDIVYLAIPDRYTPPKAQPAPDNPTFDHLVPMTETRLFRYSAATFNAHRIHYDLPFAREVEKYPGLVVHGPMQATLLMGAAVRHRGRAPDRFSFRGVHPMFHFHDLRLIGVEDGARMTLATAAPEGHQGLQATADWDTP